MRGALWRVLMSWVKATHGVVRYNVVNSPAETDITVRFAPEPSLPGKSGLVGATSVVWSGTTLKKANMELATGDIIAGRIAVDRRA